MNLQVLEQFMARLAFVQWDRYTTGQAWVSAYGWITREDNRSDFVLLHLQEGWDAPSFWTSSAGFSTAITQLLYGNAEGHVDCQRVEHAGLTLTNVIRLPPW